jgi:hypothetical protein
MESVGKRVLILCGLLMCLILFSYSKAYCASQINKDDLVLAGLSLGGDIYSAINMYGEPLNTREYYFNMGAKDKALNMFIMAVYDHLDVHYSKKSNRIFGIYSTSNDIYSTRGITVGSTVNDVLEAYGYPRTRYAVPSDQNEHYNYYYQAYRLSFKINKADGKVVEISADSFDF